MQRNNSEDLLPIRQRCRRIDTLSDGQWKGNDFRWALAKPNP